MSYAGKTSRGGRAAGTAGQGAGTGTGTASRGGARDVTALRGWSGGARAGGGGGGGGGGTGRRDAQATRGRALVRTAPSPEQDTETDWQRVAIFATGALLGVAVGAGAALLLAPTSGVEARRAIVRRGHRIGRRTRDAWDDLRDELRFAARRGRRRLGRAARSGRWAAEDALEERRRRRLAGE